MMLESVSTNDLLAELSKRFHHGVVVLENDNDDRWWRIWGNDIWGLGTAEALRLKCAGRLIDNES